MHVRTASAATSTVPTTSRIMATLPSFVTQVTSGQPASPVPISGRLTATKPQSRQLPVQEARHRDKKTLVLDLDETLIHSTFMRIGDVDFVIPVLCVRTG